MPRPRRTLLGILAERQDQRRHPGYVVLPDVDAPTDVLPPTAAVRAPFQNVVLDPRGLEIPLPPEGWVVQYSSLEETVAVIGPGFPAHRIEVLYGDGFDARLALGHQVARHLNRTSAPPSSATDDRRLSIAANALGFEMLRHDGRPIHTDSTSVAHIHVTDEETARCEAAARRVLDHLSDMRADG